MGSFRLSPVKPVLLLLVCLLALALALPAQAWQQDRSGYHAKGESVAGTNLDPEYVFGGSWATIDISSAAGAQTLAVPDDGYSASVNLGFSFDFFGTSRSEGQIHNYGAFAFGSNPGAPVNSWAEPLSDNTMGRDMVHLATSSYMMVGQCNSAVYHLTEPESSPGAGDRVFVLQIDDARHYNGGNSCTGSTNGGLDAQMRIYERFDTVEVHYKKLNSYYTTSSGYDMVAGIKGGSNADWVQYQYDAFGGSGEIVVNDQVVQYRPDGVVPLAEDDTFIFDIVKGGMTSTLGAANGVLANDLQVGAAPMELITGSLTADADVDIVLRDDGSFDVEFLDTPDPCNGGPNNDGKYTFTYELEDAWTELDPSVFSRPVGTVTLEAINCNTPPVYTGDELETPELAPDLGTTPLTFDLDDLFDDAVPTSDEDALDYTATVDVGTLAAPSGPSNDPWTYTPPVYWNGVATLDVTATDPQGASTQAFVPLTVLARNNEPVLEVADLTAQEDTPTALAGWLVSSAPTAVDENGLDHVPVQADATQSLVHSVKDHEGKGDPATDRFVDGEEPRLEAGKLTFTPDQDFFGTFWVTIEVCDDGQDEMAPGALQADPRCAEDELVVTVLNVNDDPVAVEDAFSTDEEKALFIPGADLLLTDHSGPDPKETLSVLGVRDGEKGFWDHANGGITFKPTKDFNGEAQATYEISDGNGGTAEATILVEVLPLNDRPTAQVSSVAPVDEGSGVHTLPDLVMFSMGPNDESWQSIDRVEATSYDPALLAAPPTLTADGTLTFGPAAHQYGSDVLVFEFQDSGTHDPGNDHYGVNTLSIPIQVLPVNDPPVAQDDTVDVFMNVVDHPLEVLANDADIDKDELRLVSDGFTQPSAGSVRWEPVSDRLLFTPDPGFSGTTQFTYTVKDEAGLTDTATVTLVVEDPVDPLVLLDGPAHGCVGETQTFTAQAHYRDQSAVAFAFDFGNGDTATFGAGSYQRSASQIFEEKQQRTVQVQVTFSDGSIRKVAVGHETGNCIPPTGSIHLEREDRTARLTALVTDPDGTIVSLEWDLGDGMTATGPVVEHTYAYGIHKATLTVRDDEGNTLVLEKIVNLPKPLESTGSTWSAGSGSDATGGGSTDDGSASQDGGVDDDGIQDADAGTDESQTDGQDAAGGADDRTPIARAVAPERVAMGETARLDGSASTSPEGLALTYDWKQLDGPPVELVGNATAVTTFTMPRLDGDEVATFRLRVSDGVRQDATRLEVVLEGVPQPVLDFTVTPSGPAHIFEPQDLQEDATYLWDFGDGALSREPRPLHRYEEPGTYPVHLVMEMVDGSRLEQLQMVNVESPTLPTTQQLDGHEPAPQRQSALGAGPIAWTAAAVLGLLVLAAIVVAVALVRRR